MVNLRVNKTFNFGKRPPADATGEGGEQPGGIGPGAGPRGGPGGPRGPGGPGEGRGGGRFRGSDDPPTGRVALTFSLSAQNLLNHVNAGAPVGNLGSPLFGRSLATAGGFGFGPGGGGSAAGNRRIELQARLSF
jgi:hypothetical protein